MKIKKIHEDAIIPKYQTKGSAGFDLHSLEDVFILPQETKLVRTGLTFAVPEGFEMQVRPRSGLSLKTKLRVVNSPGTIDSDYREEVMVIMQNTESENTLFGGFQSKGIHIKKGDRIAQGVICPIIQVEFEEVEELNETERKGGFGSTGLN